MNDLALSPKNKDQVDKIATSLPQSLILSISDFEWGVQIAKYLAKLSGFDFEIIYPIKNDEIDLVSGRITTSQARKLTYLANTSSKKSKIYIIYNADRMMEQAQNAFLKTFEEPNKTTFFVLLVNNRHSLLPTIISRSQTLNVNNLSSEEILRLIPSNIDSAIRNQILFISDGNPVVARYLLNNPEEIKDYSKSIVAAKEFLNLNTYQKIILLNKYKDSREEAIAMLDSLVKILQTTIKDSDKKLLILLNKTLDARNALKANFNVRLTLMHYLI